LCCEPHILFRSVWFGPLFSILDPVGLFFFSNFRLSHIRQYAFVILIFIFIFWHIIWCILCFILSSQKK